MEYSKLKEGINEKSSVKKQHFELILTTSRDSVLSIYVTGTFNNWNVADPAYKMTPLGDGRYSLTLPEINQKTIEYKYTLGDWNSAELDEYGNETRNRKASITSGQIKDSVKRWKNKGKIYKESLQPIIELVDDAFFIPQLKKSRRVRVVLPHDYYVTTKSYPVIYMQDGQNLFDHAAPFGNWGMDKRMAVLAESGKGDFIIVCIDHAESDRINEYNPYTHKTSKLGKGNGKLYVRFLAEILKPFIDDEYRTLRDRDNTGVGGSSLGGLISIYAGLMYPEVFGRLMIFSPSLWAAHNVHFDMINFFNPYYTKIYIYAGGKEGASMLPSVTKFKDGIEKRGMDDSKINVHLSIDPDGLHNEKRWGEEFPKSIDWLFFQ
ncbi:MAG: hypothetical protein KA010_02400 [Saprospiraceae bacterium]|nr:hypothetical protein [Saprospiraceae bacterium]